VCSGGNNSGGGGEEGEDDREYNPDSGSSDDEETIEQEEKEEESSKDTNKELQELEEGAEVPLEDLLKKYYPEQFADLAAPVKEESKPEEEETPAGVGTETPPVGAEEERGRQRRRKVIDFAAVERQIEEENALRKMAEEGVAATAKPEGELTEGKEEEDVKGNKKGEGKAETSEEEEEKEEKDGLKSLMEGEDKLEEYASMAAKVG
jgi:hypothetical protein